MNNIHEKDWAEDSWAGHSGMNSEDDYCYQEEHKEKNDNSNTDAPKDSSQNNS